MNTPLKLTYFALALSIGIASCASPNTQQAVTPTASPVASSSSAPTESTNRATSKTVTLTIKGDPALQGFSTQQTQEICLPELKALQTEFTLPGPLSAEARTRLEAEGASIEGNTLTINAELASIDALIQGIELELPALPAGQLKAVTHLHNAVGNSMGSLSYDIALNSDSVTLLLKPAKPENSGSHCTALIPEITGATINSTAGGLLTAAPAPTPVSSGSPNSPSAPVTDSPTANGVASITLDIDNRFLTREGEERTLTASLFDANGNPLPSSAGVIQWSSNRPNDVSIDSNGNLKALVGLGFAQITATVAGTDIKDSVLFDVTDPSFFSSNSSSNALSNSASEEPVTEPPGFAVKAHFQTCGKLNEEITVVSNAPDTLPRKLAKDSIGAVTADLQLPAGEWTIQAQKANGDVVGTVPVTVSGAGEVTYTKKGGSAFRAEGLRQVSSSPADYTISTFAGEKDTVGDGFQATNAPIGRFDYASYDPQGNVYFFSPDRIRRIDTNGVISTIAGGGAFGIRNNGDGGPATQAVIGGTRDFFRADNGDFFLVSNTNNVGLRHIDSATGIISNIDNSVQADYITGDAAGNLYFNDFGRFTRDHQLRKRDAAGNITTFSGNTAGFGGDGGQADDAAVRFNVIVDIVEHNNVLYIADQNNFRIRRIDLNTNVLTTLAGDGTDSSTGDGGQANLATIRRVQQLFVQGNDLYFMEEGDFNNSSHKLRKIDLNTNVITTAVDFTNRVDDDNSTSSGDGGPFAEAFFGSQPRNFSVDSQNNIYIFDDGNQTVRKIDPAQQVDRFAGGGVIDNQPATKALMDDPNDIVFDSKGNAYIAERSGDRIRKVDTNGIITTFMGTGDGRFNGDGKPATETKIDEPIGLAFNPEETALFITERSTNVVRKLDLQSGLVSTFAGIPRQSDDAPDNGENVQATVAKFDDPDSILFGPDGNIYMTDEGDPAVRKIDITTGIITTLVGDRSGSDGSGLEIQEGPADQVRLDEPRDLSFDPDGNLYIVNEDSNTILKLDVTTNQVTRVAGTGDGGVYGGDGPALQANLDEPYGIEIDACGNYAYISVTKDHFITRMNLATGNMELIAGIPNDGNKLSGDDGPAKNATFDEPKRMFLDVMGNLYIADEENDVVRKLAPNFN